ncbi:Protein TsgA [Candidatus Ecksteinia adelgidicola]|nr:Protein TsgA [Candidatus Ecksteinia adelgidicola]
MNDTNRIRLLWISFLSYALTGALVIVTGMVMGNVSNYFHLPISRMSNTFTFLNAGILIAIFINAWLMEIISLKRQILFGFVLMILSVIGLIESKSLILFSLSMFVLGVISGITMSIGTFLITYMYSGKKRGSRLLLTDSFFSMSGMIFPVITGIFFKKNIHWYWIYACIGLLYMGIFLLTLCTNFPILIKKDSDMKKPIIKEKWGIGVLFLSIAALCYILGQLGFIQWVPEYAIKSFGMDISNAGTLVSNFWISYMIGMWTFSYILRFFDLQRISTLLAFLSTIIMYFFSNTHQVEYLNYYIIMLGFVSSAIYTTLITLGSLQTKVVSPKLINFILTCGTIGTMLTFIITSPIVVKGGAHAALNTATLCYAIVTVMCILLGFVTKHRNYQNVIH